MVKVIGWNDMTFLKSEEFFERYRKHLGVVESTHLVLSDRVLVLRKRHNRGIHGHHVDVVNLLVSRNLLV